MSEFELNIPDDIKSTAWIEVDPFNNEGYNEIDLCINWEKKTAIVYTSIPNQGTPMEIYHGLQSEFSLPGDVDAAQFKEYYDGRIKPIVIEMSKHYESYWNGSNWKGRFVSGEVGEGGYDVYDAIDTCMHIQDLCNEAWRHDRYVYRDVAESFSAYEDIIDMLKYADIDFMTADLDDMDVVRAIREYLTDDCVYIMTDEQFQRDIQGMRETIVEERGA